MNNQPLKVIVIGAGRIGELHARNVHERVASLEVCAVVEPHPSSSFSAWAESRAIPLVDEFDTGVGMTDPAAAIIAVPTDLHEEVAMKALEAGLHIFCEKPVASDIEAARRIVEAAEDASKILQIGFNRRFDRNFAAVERAVRNGRIGKIEMIRVTSRDPAPPPMEYIRRSGGLFMDMTIHDFDMVRFLSGDNFKEVQVMGASLVDPAIGEAGDIDSAVITFRLESGAIGVIENSRRAIYGYDQRAEVLGADGAAGIANEKPSTIQVSTKNSVAQENPLYFFLERYRDSFVSELNAFAEAITAGGRASVDGSDGIEAMRAAEACRRSLAERRPVALTEIQ